MEKRSTAFMYRIATAGRREWRKGNILSSIERRGRRPTQSREAGGIIELAHPSKSSRRWSGVGKRAKLRRERELPGVAYIPHPDEEA